MKDMFNIVNRVKAVKTFKGIDSQGFESIVFIFKKQPKFELKTTKISSRIFERSNQFRLFISLIDDDEKSTEIFNVLTEDLLSCVENAITEQEVLEILASRFQYWSNIIEMKKVIAYIKESYDELVHKVSWPTYSELANSAVVVLYASLLIAVVVFAMDFCFQHLMEFVYPH